MGTSWYIAVLPIRPKKTDEDEIGAIEFIERMRKYFRSPHCHQISMLNLDQTASYYCMVPKTAINLKGAHSINMRMTSDANKASLQPLL